MKRNATILISVIAALMASAALSACGTMEADACPPGAGANECWQARSFARANTEGRRTGNMPVGYASQWWNGSTGGRTGPEGATRAVGTPIN